MVSFRRRAHPGAARTRLGAVEDWRVPEPPSLDELYNAYLKELASGTENQEGPISVGFQFRVAKAQEKWARISAMIAGASVAVAIAALIVAAIR